MRRRLPILVLTAVLLIPAACNRDKDDYIEPSTPSQSAWSVSRADDFDGIVSDLSPQAGYESISVSIMGRTSDTKSVVVASDCDWLTVLRDTLAADSIVSIATTNNSGGQRRVATITFADAENPALSASLEVTQLSAAENDNNGGYYTARQQLYVGYGYNIYAELESEMSVRTKAPIIDLDNLKKRNVASRYTIVQDCRITRTITRYTSSNDIHAHGENLTEQQVGSNKEHIVGCLVNCEKVEDIIQPNNGTLFQQCIGHGSFEKAVASRVIDRAALLDLQRIGDVPFTDDFINRLLIIRKKTGRIRAKQIEQTLVDYGTHLIVRADLGGRIDYTFTMQQSVSFNSRQEMEDEINYTLGRISNGDRKTKAKPVSSRKSGGITIQGGSESTRSRLRNDIQGLTPSGQIDPSHITDWLASINYSANLGSDPNLGVIHFELIPLWDIVWDDLKAEFRDATLSLVSRSDCQLPDNFLNTDIYEFSPTTDDELFSFANATSSSSLCRILYFGDEPILQVCSEYVPKIRTDKRVTIAYPIYKQHIRLNQGIFIGDGIHQPSLVCFGGGDCYIYPYNEYQPGDYVEKFWYVNGSILTNNPTGLDALTGKNRTVLDDQLILYIDAQKNSGFHRHPIVKVGCNFWTRSDIDHNMLFAEDVNSSTLDHLNESNGILYTMFQFDTNYEFNATNDWIWGYKPNQYFDTKPNSLWYLPTADEVKSLYAYLGFNPKALFKGEVSGWDAQFNGYYGDSDILNGNKYFSGRKQALRYNGTLNIIASRNSSDIDDACLMVLSDNYSTSLIDNNTVNTPYRAIWRNNCYPVRPTRGYMYTYPPLSEIKKRMN